MRKIRMTDMTLCESDALNFRQKIEVARQMDALQMDVIELSPISDVRTDALFMRTIAPLIERSTLSCPVTNRQEADWAAEALSRAHAVRLNVTLPVSVVQMEYMLHKKPPKMIEYLIELVGACADKGVEVAFTAVDASRAERGHLKAAVEAAVRAGASCVTLCDTAGQLLPGEMAALVADVRPSAGEAAVGVRCADEMAMAAANSFAAVQAGANEVCVSYAGRTAGPIKAVAHAIRLRGDSVDAAADVKYTELTRITDALAEITEAQKKTTAIDTQFGGVEVDMLLTADISRSAFTKEVRKLGYQLDEADLSRVYEAFRRVVRRKSVGAKDLEAIIASNAQQVPATYRLVSYVINSGNAINATAHITVEKDGQPLDGLAMGDGPVDASFIALEKIVGHHYELDDFQISAVTEGRDSLGSALVKLRANGKLYSGNGISTDIIGACIYAYMNALNKIVYEENA